MFDAGSIAERTPEQNKQIKIEAKQDGNIQTNTDMYINTCESTNTNLYTIHKRNTKSQTCESGSMRAMLNWGSKLENTILEI